MRHRRLARYADQGPAPHLCARRGASNCSSPTRALPFHDRSFDLVIVGYLFDLLPETDFGLVIAEIHRVLRDSGRVVVDMTIAERRRDDVHRWVSRLRPRLLGGCRGVRLAACLASGGFEVEHRVGGEYSSGRADLRFCRSSVVGSELGRTTRSARIDLRSAAAVEVLSALASQRCRDAVIESAAIVSDSGLHRRGLRSRR